MVASMVGGLSPDMNTAGLMAEVRREDSLWRNHLVGTYGVKAIHPDDGNVDRGKNSVCLAYPIYNARPAVGDLVALGSPPHYRLVRVTRIESRPIGLSDYHFEATDASVSPPEK